MSACTAADCLSLAIARGLCNRHRLRVAKYGTTDLPKRSDVVTRLLRRCTQTEDGCWIWRGAVGTHGYGVIGLGTRAEGTALTHRVAYEAFIVSVPADLHLDHLCRNVLCANPWHLDPVPQAVNNTRQWDARKAMA